MFSLTIILWTFSLHLYNSEKPVYNKCKHGKNILKALVCIYMIARFTTPLLLWTFKEIQAVEVAHFKIKGFWFASWHHCSTRYLHVVGKVTFLSLGLYIFFLMREIRITRWSMGRVVMSMLGNNAYYIENSFLFFALLWLLIICHIFISCCSVPVDCLNFLWLFLSLWDITVHFLVYEREHNLTLTQKLHLIMQILSIYFTPNSQKK